MIKELSIAAMCKMDKNQLSLKVTLKVKMCSRVRNQLAKAFELNVKENCNLIIINNRRMCG